MSTNNKIRFIIIVVTLLLLSLACMSSTSDRLTNAAQDSTQAAQIPPTTAGTVETKPTETSIAIKTEEVKELQLLDQQGFFQDGIEAVAVFLVKNPYEQMAIESSAYQVEFYDEAGTVLKTESGYIEVLLPGEQIGVTVTTYLDEGEKVASIKVQLDTGKANESDLVPPLFATESVTFIADQFFPKVTGIIKNNLARDITNLRLNAVAYDDAGNIIGGGYTYVDFIPSSGQSGIDVSIKVPVAPARVELYPTLSGLSALDQEVTTGPRVELVSQDFVQNSQEVTVVFFVENIEGKQAVESSQYQVAVYDDGGNVLGSDSGYITIVLPGEKLAYSAIVYVPDGEIAAKVEVQILSGEPYDVSISGLPFQAESVQFIADPNFPKITGIIKNGLDRNVSEMRITAVGYDEAGKVIGGGFTYLNFLPASGQSPVEISAKISGNPVKVELYPTLSGLSVFESSASEQNLQLVSAGMGYGTFGTNITFLVKNASPDKVLERSQYQVAIYDEAGSVLGTDSGYISLIFPQETVAQSADIMIPDGKTPARFEVQLSDGSPAITDLGQNPLTGEQANFLHDAYFPKVTGIVKNSLDQQIKDVEVVAITYDQDGNVIGGGFTFLDFVPANGTSAVEINVGVSGTPAKMEIYPTFSGLTSIGE